MRVRRPLVRRTVHLDGLTHCERPHSTTTADCMYFPFHTRGQITLLWGYSACGESYDSNTSTPTWNNVKPPRLPEPVAATSSATGRSYDCLVSAGQEHGLHTHAPLLALGRRSGRKWAHTQGWSRITTGVPRYASALRLLHSPLLLTAHLAASNLAHRGLANSS